MTREEGFRKLFNGADWASSRAVLVTVGQLCFYDVVKEKLLETGRFQDDTRTHLLSGVTAVCVNIRYLEVKGKFHLRLMSDKLDWIFKEPV